MKSFLEVFLLCALATGPGTEGCGSKGRSGQATAAVAERAENTETTARSPQMPQELEQYRSTALALHHEAKRSGLENVHSTITLAEPLAGNVAAALIEAYGLHPNLLYFFSQDDDSQISTGAVSVDERSLERNLASITRPTGRGGRTLGIVSIIATVPVKQLDALQGDPRVYLVDIQADEHFTPENRGNRNYAHHLAWDLYQIRTGKVHGTAPKKNPRK